MQTMRSALVRICAGVAVAAVFSLGQAQAQAVRTAHAPAAVVSMINTLETGTWSVDEPGCFGFFFNCYESQATYVDGEIPKHPFPLKPEFAAEFKKIQASLATGVSVFDPDAQCYPAGMPGKARTTFKLVFQTDRIFFLYGGAEFRTVYMDGRKFPEQDPAEYTFNGYSIGKWDGDTLVVETRNLVGPNTQIPPNVPKSDNFWIIERFKPVSGDVFDYSITMKDEDRWTSQYVQKYRWTRTASGDLGPQQPCISGEGQRYVPNPVTGALELTGPGGMALEKAEP